MSVLLLVVLVTVAYVCLIVFVLGMLRAAKRGDEALGPNAESRFVREEELELTPEDADFFARLGRR